MSADNIIFVRKRNDSWYVWYQGNPEEPIFDSTNKFATRAGALLFAHDMYQNIGLVEYGVVELDE